MIELTDEQREEIRRLSEAFGKSVIMKVELYDYRLEEIDHETNKIVEAIAADFNDGKCDYAVMWNEISDWSPEDFAARYLERNLELLNKK
jgi:hypothetical protein